MSGPPETKSTGLQCRTDQADALVAPASRPEAYQKRQFAAESFRCKLCNRIMADSLPGAPPAAGLCLLCTAEFGGQINGLN